TSIESIERNSQITWTAAGVQKGSAGKGAKHGGDSELIAGRVREPAKLRYLLGRSSSKIEGMNGGRSGVPGELEIIRAADGKKETFKNVEGTLELLAGDEFRLQGAGGGAWGEPTPEKAKTTAIADEE
ncbi:MAG: hypothetical protein EOP05_13035, partial [Proteobacteria bacterium]